MQAVWERNVHGVDVGLRKQLVVRAIRIWDPVFFGMVLSLCEASCGDCNDNGVWMGANRVEQCGGIDASCREDSEANWIGRLRGAYLGDASIPVIQARDKLLGCQVYRPCAEATRTSTVPDILSTVC